MMQSPDQRPGAYFVSCIHAGRVALLAGPFVDDHASALAMVDQTRQVAYQVDRRAIWYAFGTVRLDRDHPRAAQAGPLNAQLALT